MLKDIHEPQVSSIPIQAAAILLLVFIILVDMCYPGKLQIWNMS